MLITCRIFRSLSKEPTSSATHDPNERDLLSSGGASATGRFATRLVLARSYESPDDGGYYGEDAADPDGTDIDVAPFDHDFAGAGDAKLGRVCN
jgi:hypothetical protein